MGLGTGSFHFQLGAIIRIWKKKWKQQQQAACDFDVDVKRAGTEFYFLSFTFSLVLYHDLWIPTKIFALISLISWLAFLGQFPTLYNRIYCF